MTPELAAGRARRSSGKRPSIMEDSAGGGPEALALKQRLEQLGTVERQAIELLAALFVEDIRRFPELYPELYAYGEEIGP